MSTISRGFARYFCEDFSYDRIPKITKENVKKLLMDYLGVALKGTQTETGKIVRSYFADKGGISEATLFSSNIKIPAESTAFANAVCSHSIEMDDIDRLALFHFSPPIYSAALAVAEWKDVSGKEFITSVAAGVEIMERLSRALNPELRNRGYHTTPTCGIFGAVTASSMMMSLTEEQFISAYGLAGAQVAGVLEFYGESMQKRINPGPAAHNAILSAKLAQRGFTGADTIFEGKRGVCRVYSDKCDWTVLENFKQGDYIFEIEFKPYACARPIHSTIDAALSIRKQMAEKGKTIQEIVKVDVYRHPWWADYHTEQNPKTYHDAQMSMCYSVALALVTGNNFFSDYIDTVQNRNEAVFELTKKVNSVRDDNSKNENSTGCWAVAVFTDGTEIKAEATYPKGSVENPMSAEEQMAKFQRLTDFKFSKSQTEELSNIIDHLEDYNISDVLSFVNL